MTANTVQRLRVGEWLLDPATNEISRGSERVHLEPKTVDLLVALASRPNQVVSREELLSQVWSGVVVGDDVLTQGVIKLRKALGDALIQTIPKRGYRLTGEVSWHDREPGAARAKAPRRVYWIAGACVVAVAALAGLWLYVVEKSSPLAMVSADAIKAARMDASPKITVYSFKEIAGDARQSLLARGFTSRLITDLGRLPDLRVITLPPQSVQAAAQGESGRGSYVVTGEVQSSAGKIRLYVRLVDAASGESLWSEQYDRPYSDLLALQDELTQRVLERLRIKVGDAELRRRAQPYTRNLQAYEYFLRARAALNVRSKSGNEAARNFYLKAVELDPSFARAHAGLALTYAADRRNNWTPDAKAALAKATGLARTALQLDPNAPEVLFAWAFVAMERGALSDSIGYLRTALRLNPSYADAYALMAGIQTYDGRPAETIPLIRVAMRLAPDSGYLYSLILGRAYFFLGNTDSALLNLRQAVERNHESVESHLYLAAALAAAGRRDAAAWEAEEIRLLDPGFRSKEWLRNYPMTDSGQIRRLSEILRSLDL
ncbi:MAG TPA: winged helix-turn-helix domain-containing protein [Burkholderiales bacterium]|nr:winged helix-turn-helix domain-containing protein [Burkholderiales bacterium]